MHLKLLEINKDFECNKNILKKHIRKLNPFLNIVFNIQTGYSIDCARKRFQLQDDPLIFMKAASCVCAPNVCCSCCCCCCCVWQLSAVNGIYVGLVKFDDNMKLPLPLP